MDMYKRTSIVLDVVRQTPYLPIPPAVRSVMYSVFPPRSHPVGVSPPRPVAAWYETSMVTLSIVVCLETSGAN
jgi:hypothetical protein